MEIINNKLYSIESEDLTNGTINLDDNIKIIGEYAFGNIASLNSMKFPKSLEEICTGGFAGCTYLSQVTFQDGLKKIGDWAFYYTPITEALIPNSVVKIGERVFCFCNELSKVVLPQNLKEIGAYLFYGCSNLKSIELSQHLKTIGESAFEQSGLESIKIPNSVQSIGNALFYECIDLKNIILPESLKIIPRNAFAKCRNLKEIQLPEGLEEIEDNAFYMCEKLKKLSIPSSVIYVGDAVFSGCLELKEIELYSDTTLASCGLKNCDISIINPRTKGKKTIHGVEPMDFSAIYYGHGMHKERNSLCIFNDKKMCFFDQDDEWVELYYSQIDYKIEIPYIRNLYEWKKLKKFLPHQLVIKNMPIEEIENFYINNNHKKWGELLRLAKVDLDVEKSAFFDICYVLGLFSDKGKISDRAYEFIKNELIPTVDHNNYHVRFGGLRINANRFNAEFAELVFKHYTNEDFGKNFLIYQDDFTQQKIDYFVAVFNEFEKIKTIYPNKRVNTNRDIDELTPKLCMEVIRSRAYNDVNLGNEELARYVGMCGYSQEEFERIQELFEEGKNILTSEITLLVTPDDDNNLVTYELLEKDNPLGAILGNITNCCQTLNGAGKECVEYGLSKRNSKFMVFRMNNKIIGQSWVWYDEKTYRICLDNIEVPTSILKKELQDEEVQNAFVECLKRSVNGFLNEMDKKNLKVNRISIGEGFNDIANLLKSFTKITDQMPLSDYFGYSDASCQYVLYEKTHL